MARRLKFWIAWYIPLVGLWLAFVSTLERHELLLGLAAAAVGATAQELVNAQDLVRFRLEPRWLRDLWLLPWQALTDSWLVTVVLWRQLARGQAAAGAFRTVPLPVPPEDDARANARRALLTATVSVAANTYVVGIEGEEGTMLVHQLVPSADPLVPASMLAGAGPAPDRTGDHLEGP
jgi:multisubunit Na+/H+ antiporter MnhE subunit